MSPTSSFSTTGLPRGLPRLLADMTSHIPVARHAVPSLAHVTMANAAPLHAVNFNIAGETTPISNGEENGASQMTATNDNTLPGGHDGRDIGHGKAKC